MRVRTKIYRQHVGNFKKKFFLKKNFFSCTQQEKTKKFRFLAKNAFFAPCAKCAKMHILRAGF